MPKIQSKYFSQTTVGATFYNCAVEIFSSLCNKDKLCAVVVGNDICCDLLKDVKKVLQFDKHKISGINEFKLLTCKEKLSLSESCKYYF